VQEMDAVERTSSRFFWPGLLLALTALQFLPNLIRGLPVLDVPESVDLANQWQPYYYFLKESYLSYHSFPLWNPYDQCGTPFLAFSHSSSLYLFNIFHLAGFPLAVSLSVLFHLMIAGLGTFFLLRSLNASEPASLICGLSYSLGGYVFNNINFFPSLYSSSWLPFVFLFGVRLLKALKVADFLGLGASAALALYGGDIEITVFGFLVLFGLQIALKAETRGPRLKPVFVTLLGIGFGVFIFMAQFLPSLEMLHNSIRGGAAAGQVSLRMSFWEVLKSFLPPLVSLFYPYPDTTYKPLTMKGMNGLYLGLVALLGFIIGFWKEKGFRKAAWIFAAAAVYIIVSMVPQLHRFIAWAPMLGQSIVPFRLLTASELVFLIIAGLGIGHMLSGELKRLSRVWIVWLSAFAIVLVALDIILRKDFPIGGFELRLLSAFLLLSLVFLSGRVKAKWLIAALFAVDIYGWTALHFPGTSYQKFRLEPQLEATISNTDPGNRYYIFGTYVVDAELPHSAGIMLKAATIDSWTRLPLRRYAELLSLLFPELFVKENGRLVYYDQMASRNLLQAPPDRVYLLNLLNVRWLVSRLRIPESMTKFEFEEESFSPLYVYENPRALARAFLAEKVELLGSEQDVLKEMGKGKFAYGAMVLSSNPEMESSQYGLPAEAAEDSSQRVTITRPSPDRLSAKTASLNPGWMFLSEIYYPGWRAKVDDQEVRIFPADYAFRAVFVPAGKHKISFWYEPVSFRGGVYASISAALVFLLTAAVSLIRRFSANRPRQP